MKFKQRRILLKNKESFLLREAQGEDAGAILAYLNRVGGESDNLLFGKNEFALSVEQEEAFLTAQQEEERSLILLGFYGEELVSVSSLSAFSFRKRIAHRAEVALSVRKDFWGLSIGTQALQSLLEFAKNRGVEVVELQVRADNERAIALYKKLGFEVLGLYKNYFKMDNGYYDAYCMNKYFQK